MRRLLKNICINIFKKEKMAGRREGGSPAPSIGEPPLERVHSDWDLLFSGWTPSIGVCRSKGHLRFFFRRVGCLQNVYKKRFLYGQTKNNTQWGIWHEAMTSLLLLHCYVYEERESKSESEKERESHELAREGVR